MSRVEFRGLQAGLSHGKSGGDSNDPSNYILICGCELELGPVAGARPNSEGQRSIGCPRCQMATILDKNMKQLAFVPISAILELQKKRGA